MMEGAGEDGGELRPMELAAVIWPRRRRKWWIPAKLGVQVEDELQALPKLHVKFLSATIAFSFDSSIQIPQ